MVLNILSLSWKNRDSYMNIHRDDITESDESLKINLLILFKLKIIKIQKKELFDWKVFLFQMSEFYVIIFHKFID